MQKINWRTVNLSNKYTKAILLSIYLLSVLLYLRICSRYIVANVWSSLLFYISLFLLLYACLTIVKGRLISKNTYSNLLLSCSVGIAFLFTGELSLRYIFKKGLTQSERTEQYYRSYYRGKHNKAKKRRKEKESLKVRANRQQFTSQSRNEFSYEHHYNRQGLREREISPSLPDSALIKIIGIGDSYTEGVGTHQDSTWLRVMEAQLLASGTPPLLCINAGFAGSNPVKDLNRLRIILPHIKPQLVIQAINQSDISDIAVKATGHFKAPWWEIIYANSLFFRGILHVVFDYSGSLMSSEEYKEAKKLAEDLIKNCIEEQKVLGAQYGFEILVLFHPHLREIQDFGKLELAHFRDELKKDTSLYVVDLMELWQKEQGVNAQNVAALYWPMDRHNNRAGYELWGKALAQWMIEKDLLNKL